MYDSIICKYPLPQPVDPKGYVPSQAFQTKDFDCSLDLYEIDEKGQLYFSRTEGYHKEDKQSFMGLGKYVITNKIKDALTTSQEIIMYDYVHSSYSDFDYSIDYSVKFVNGIIQEAKLINFDAWSNAERKQKDEEWKITLKERHDFMQTRRYKYLYAPYNKVLKFTARGIGECLNKLSMAINKLEIKLHI